MSNSSKNVGAIEGFASDLDEVEIVLVELHQASNNEKQNIGSGSSKDGATNGPRGVKNAMHEIETAPAYFPCVIWSRPEAGPPHFFVMAFVLLLA